MSEPSAGHDRIARDRRCFADHTALGTGLLASIYADCVGCELEARGIIPFEREVRLPTYLKLSGHTLGLLVNFNVVLIKHGI